MDAQAIDQEATKMEMNSNNIHLYLLAGKQAVRIDMLESTLDASERERAKLTKALEQANTRIAGFNTSEERDG